jgi:hypothetical protein
MSFICVSIVDGRRGFALGEDTIRNHWKSDDAAAGKSAFQFSKFLAIIVLRHFLGIVRLLAVSSKSRTKQYVLLNLALNQLFI